MPIYRLLFVFLFVFCVSAGFFVRDISGVGGHRAMKFGRVVDFSVHQVLSPFGEIWPRGGQKLKNFGNAYLVDRLRDRAEILYNGRFRRIVGHLRFW